MNDLFLSIITINFNNINGLKKTLDSVFSQKSRNFEYIIIDGKSTDGGKELILQYLKAEENKKIVSFWCSEKDGGIWDAMNKGVSHARGKYTLMLNSGDALRNENVVSNLEKMNLQEDLIYANSNCITVKGNYVLSYPDLINSDFFKEGNTLGHQNTLISTDITKKIPYHLDYKYAGDIVFFIESIIENKCTTKHINYCIADFDAETGCSSVEETKEARFDEWIRIWQTYFPGKLYQDYLKLNEYEYAYRGICRRIMSFIKKIRGNYK